MWGVLNRLQGSAPEGGGQQGTQANPLEGIVRDLTALFTQIQIFEHVNPNGAGVGSGQAGGELLELNRRVGEFADRISRGVKDGFNATQLRQYLASNEFKGLPDSYLRVVHRRLQYISKNIVTPPSFWAPLQTRFGHHLVKVLGPAWVKAAQFALIVGGVVNYVYLNKHCNNDDCTTKAVERRAAVFALCALGGTFYVLLSAQALSRGFGFDPRDDK